MANMSDIPTEDVGIIAFWNAEDHRIGGTGFDPTDCKGVFDSYDVYDNGIEGYKALGSGRYFHARVKSDGWIIAWIDRTNTYFYPNKTASDFGEGAHKGYYDILWNWFKGDGNISSTQTTLSYLISLLYDALTNKADFSYINEDVGHYCYEYPYANTFTLMDVRTAPEQSQSGYVQYTSGTTLYYAAVTGSTKSDTNKVKFAGNTITDGSGTKYGTADIIAENWMPDPLANYELYCLSQYSYSGADGSVIIIWA